MDIASVLITAFVVISIIGVQPQDKRVSSASPSVSTAIISQTVSTNYEFALSEDRTHMLFLPLDDARVIQTYLDTRYKKLDPFERQAIVENLVKYGHEFLVEPRLVAALVARESGFNRWSISPSNAKGLGQILEFNYLTLKITDPFDIEQGVRGCTQYLAMMLKRWEGKPNQVALALASYNEGCGTISRAACAWRPSTDMYIRDINVTYKYLLNQ